MDAPTLYVATGTIKPAKRVVLLTMDSDGPSCERTDRSVDSDVPYAVANDYTCHRLSSHLHHHHHLITIPTLL